MMKKLITAFAMIASCTALADDGFVDRPSGVKLGSRMTLRPYVSLSFSWDSNPDCGSRSAKEDAAYFTANPGLGFDYLGDNWKLTGSAYYVYHAFTSGHESQLNNDSYGEALAYTWSNIVNRGPGWMLTLRETYAKINQNDDIKNGGKGLWRDRQQFTASVIGMRRFDERWYAAINTSYYWLEYDNDANSYAPLYGWDRWGGFLELGATVSRYADIFVTGGYQYYNQDNGNGASIGNRSDGWTAHAGLQGKPTEKLSYRVSGGVSSFDYGDTSSDYGFTYEGSLKWNITSTLMTSLLFSSHYQPSERQYGSAIRCDNVSWGIAKGFVRNKLNTTFDIAYRCDTHVYARNSNNDWDINLISARLGASYIINRFFTVFARGEFQQELNRGGNISSNYDYNRWRVTVGLKLTY